MGNSGDQQTKGLEKLEFLTDKAKRLVFQLESDEEGLEKLRKDMLAVSRKRKELAETNRDLKTKLSSLQSDREKVEEKITKLLGAIGDLPLD